MLENSVTAGRGTRSATSRRPFWRPVAGSALALASMPLLVVLPEAALPMALLALRLLATRFALASKVDVQLRRHRAQLRVWFAARSPVVKVLLGGGLLVAAASALWWSIGAFV